MATPGLISKTFRRSQGRPKSEHIHAIVSAAIVSATNEEYPHVMALEIRIADDWLIQRIRSPDSSGVYICNDTDQDQEIPFTEVGMQIGMILSVSPTENAYRSRSFREPGVFVHESADSSTL